MVDQLVDSGNDGSWPPGDTHESCMCTSSVCVCVRSNTSGEK